MTLAKKLILLALSASLTLVAAFALAGCSSTKVNPEDFVGTYQDATSQRASMMVWQNEDDTLSSQVTWANSAEDGTIWTINFTDADDAKLSYDEYNRGSYDGNSGNATLVEKAGYFEYEIDGDAVTLKWTGSPEESCQECVFERISTDVDLPTTI